MDSSNSKELSILESLVGKMFDREVKERENIYTNKSPFKEIDKLIEINKKEWKNIDPYNTLFNLVIDSEEQSKDRYLSDFSWNKFNVEFGKIKTYDRDSLSFYSFMRIFKSNYGQDWENIPKKELSKMKEILDNYYSENIK